MPNFRGRYRLFSSNTRTFFDRRIAYYTTGTQSVISADIPTIAIAITKAKGRLLLDESAWSVECLQRYLAVSKWHHPSNEIKEGSLILITHERYPPGKWPLARVIQLYPGPDGLTRVVIKTSISTYKRPISKLCILPTDSKILLSTTSLSKAGGNVTSFQKETIERAGHR